MIKSPLLAVIYISLSFLSPKGERERDIGFGG